MKKLSKPASSLQNTNFEKLAELFPSVVSEAKDDDSGELTYKVDFDALKALLGDKSVIKDGEEHYSFNWVGKSQASQSAAIWDKSHQREKTLKPDVESSKDWDTTQNLFIEGDNLNALKLLQESYLGKVKMIYIDPPYNTGKDFVYKDNFRKSAVQHDQDINYKDEDGNINFKKNEKTNGRYHSDWLSMMYPRLKLAKNILADDGIAFISIGENELSNLTIMCNEIFGEDNKLTTISRLMKSGGNKGQHFSPNIDYILVYARQIDEIDSLRIPLEQSYVEKIYNKIDKHGRKYREMGLYQSGLDTRPNQRYWVKCPDGELVIPPGETFPELTENVVVRPNKDDGVWRWSKDTFVSALSEGKIEFKETKSSSLLNQDQKQAKWNIYTKIYLDDRLEEGRVPKNIITEFENRHSSRELKNLKIPFDFAKPIGLIKHLTQIADTNNDTIVLDFFSGSGSTAHAIMELNAEDGGTRKHIQIQLPEKTEKESSEYVEGYITIPEISRERIRRAGEKIKKDFKEELAKRETPLDVGFRSFTIADSSFKDTKIPAGEITQTELTEAVDNIKSDRINLDLLIEAMLSPELRMELSASITTKQTAGTELFTVNDGYLVACFDKEVSDIQALVDAVSQASPTHVVVRDATFATDSDRHNFETWLKQKTSSINNVWVI